MVSTPMLRGDEMVNSPIEGTDISDQGHRGRERNG
jgi:hypothetical protein